MAEFEHFSAKIKHYKCFGEKEQGFDCIKPMNLIIGRNNSGKSSLLDLIQLLTEEKPKFEEVQYHQKLKQPPQIIIKTPCNEDELKAVFREHHSDEDIGDHWNFGKRYVGRILKWQYQSSLSINKFLSLEESPLQKEIRNREAIEQKFFLS